MIKKEDIKRAIKIFKEWDNNNRWGAPKEIFKKHTLEKSENALKTSKYILKIMEDQKIKDLFNADDYDGTLWIINASYYSVFFLAQYLLALDNKKLAENIEDTHKIVELALMYYFIIKGSNLESKKNLDWNDIKESKISKALEMMADAQEEISELTQQKAKRVVEYMDAERIKRNKFTYRMTVNAELERAKTSIKRAIEFGDIIKEYIIIKKLN